MICKLCPTRKHCWDKGDCQNCDFGKAFNGLDKKLKRLKAQNEKLKAENEALLQRLAETENGNEQTLYLERLMNNDLTAEVERLRAEHAQHQLDLHYSVCREDTAYNRGYDRANIEVAKKIFEELEYLSMDGRIAMNGYYTELKVKYTGEKI